MNWQILSKSLNPWMIVLILAGSAITGVTIYHNISEFGQTSKPSQPTSTTPAIQQITALGRLEPVSEVIKVSAPSTLNNDRVAQLLVKRGDSVKAGQEIAILANRDRLQDALLEAQQQVKVAQSKLAQIKAGAKSGEITAQQAQIARLQAQLQGEIASQAATIARRQSEVNNASLEYERYLALYREGAVSASQFDQRRLTLETTRSQLKEDTANRNRTADTLRAQITEAKATLDRIAEVRPIDVEVAQNEVDQAITAAKRAATELNQAYIRAPIAGQILEIYTKPGEAIGNNGIVDLGQTSQMEVIAEVYQTDINKIRVGQQAVITSESFPGELRGSVRLIGLQVTKQRVFSNQPGENLDRRVIEVRIRLNPEDSKRVAGLTNLQVQAAIQL